MDANSTLLSGPGGGLNTTAANGTSSSPGVPLPPRSVAEAAWAFLEDTQAGWMELKLLCSALGIIYLGAHAALRRPPSARAPRTRRERRRDEDEAAARGMELSDAILLPLTAGLLLVGMYELIQWLQDPAILNKIMRWYLSAASVVCLATLYAHGLELATSCVFPAYWRAGDGSLRKVDQKRRVVARCDDVGNLLEGGEQQQQQHHRHQHQHQQHESQPAATASPLPGMLGLLTPSERLRGAAWDLRDLLTREWVVRVYAHGMGEESARIKFAHMTALIAALGTALVYFATQWTALSNVLGYGLSYTSFLVLSPTDFLTGSLVLSSLFVYDIVMVFYTPYMLTVATKLDVPIKLTFEAAERKSMLGLGDIVVPGILIGFALRLDLWIHYLGKMKREPVALKIVERDAASGRAVERGETKHIEVKAPYLSAKGSWGERLWTARGPAALLQRRGAARRGDGLPPKIAATRFPKVYFHAAMAGYLAGMLATLVMVLVFRQGQPALLYLVPGVLGALLATSLARGEFGLLWRYTENGSLDTVDVVVDLDERGNVVQALGNLEDGKLDLTMGEKEKKDGKPRTDEGEKKREKDGEGRGEKRYVFSLSLEVPSDEEHDD